MLLLFKRNEVPVLHALELYDHTYKLVVKRKVVVGDLQVFSPTGFRIIAHFLYNCVPNHLFVSALAGLWLKHLPCLLVALRYGQTCTTYCARIATDRIYHGLWSAGSKSDNYEFVQILQFFNHLHNLQVEVFLNMIPKRLLPSWINSVPRHSDGSQWS